MSHAIPSSSDSPTLEPREGVNRTVAWLLLLTASTTGVLGAALLFAIVCTRSGPRSDAAELATTAADVVAEAAEKANADPTRPVASTDTAKAAAEARSESPVAVVSDSVPLTLDAGMKAIAPAASSEDSPEVPGVSASFASIAPRRSPLDPLAASAVLPGERLDRDPLAELGMKDVESEVATALHEEGVTERLYRPAWLEADILTSELSRSVTELEIGRRTLDSLMRTSSDDGRLQAMVARLDDIQGLPFRWGDECHSDADQTKMLTSVPAVVRRMQTLEQSLGAGGDANTQMLKQALSRSVVHLLEDDDWNGPEAVPALEQVFQVEGPEIRLALVRRLGAIDCKKSTEALVRRALYDLDADVRTEAVEQLAWRSSDDYLDLLMAGFRYPWDPVAWNAAEALVQLEAREVIPELLHLLEAPDPRDPYVNDQGNWAVKELVAVNHLKNCQLCHTQSVATSDPLRGVVPIPEQRLPQIYYASQNKSFQFVRADVTYLKQDFSLVQEVRNHGPWPEKQRFDYIVRERELRGEEAPALSGTPSGGLEDAKRKKDYAQRRAVLFALQRLSGVEPPAVASSRDLRESFLAAVGAR
ncbi:MAG: HEAT repeat domain-containing protein [Pirellulaceae bacterium]